MFSRPVAAPRSLASTRSRPPPTRGHSTGSRSAGAAARRPTVTPRGDFATPAWRTLHASAAVTPRGDFATPSVVNSPRSAPSAAGSVALRCAARFARAGRVSVGGGRVCNRGSPPPRDRGNANRRRPHAGAFRSVAAERALAHKTGNASVARGRIRFPPPRAGSALRSDAPSTARVTRIASRGARGTRRGDRLRARGSPRSATQPRPMVAAAANPRTGRRGRAPTTARARSARGRHGRNARGRGTKPAPGQRSRAGASAPSAAAAGAGATGSEVVRGQASRPRARRRADRRRARPRRGVAAG